MHILIGDTFTEIRIGDTFTEIKIGDTFTEIRIGDTFTEIEIGDTFTEIRIGDTFTEIRILDFEILNWMQMFYGKNSEILNYQVNLQILVRVALTTILLVRLQACTQIFENGVVNLGYFTQGVRILRKSRF